MRTSSPRAVRRSSRSPRAPRGLGSRCSSRNTAAVYDREHMREVGRLLLEREGAYWGFYSTEEVSELMTAAAVSS